MAIATGMLLAGLLHVDDVLWHELPFDEVPNGHDRLRRSIILVQTGKEILP